MRTPSRRHIACLAAAVIAVTGAFVPTPASAATSGPQIVIEATTNEEVISAYSVATVTPAFSPVDVSPQCAAMPLGNVTVTPDGSCMDLAVCKKLYSVYKIYIPLGPTLVDWKFNYHWCYRLGKISYFVDSDSLSVYSPSIRVTGSLSHTRGALGGTVIRSLYEGRNFQFCPITNPFGTNCIAEFHPKIDMYFLVGGTYLDQSII